MSQSERAAFTIILVVIAIYGMVILGVMGFCLVYSRAIVEGRYDCDAKGRVFELLGQLNTLVGIAAGFLLRGKVT